MAGDSFRCGGRVGPAAHLHDERHRPKSTGSAQHPRPRGVLPGHHPSAGLACRGYRSRMASPKEILAVSGREVAISNPQKVYFPQTGHTKLDLVRYYLSVADGALTGVAGSPDGAQALRRRRGGRAVLPEAGARQPARLDPDGRADVSVGPDRRRDRRRRRGRPGVGGQPRLHRPEPASGPCRRP